MKRYDMVMNYRCGQSVEELERADDGEWIRYEDIEPLAHAATLLAKSLTDDMIHTIRVEWGNTNAAVLAHWRSKILGGCDCEASGNLDKPKQHGADPHAKNCRVYLR
jgi:hypothetical protein